MIMEGRLIMGECYIVDNYFLEGPSQKNLVCLLIIV